jgi:hypothetical protein
MIAQVHGAMRESVEASAEAALAQACADAATDAQYQCVAIANRIETLGVSFVRWNGASTLTITTANTATQPRFRSTSGCVVMLVPPVD